MKRMKRIYGIMACAAFVTITYVQDDTTGVQLTTEQSNMIIEQIGRHEFQKVQLYNCNESIAEFINHGRWSVSTCRNMYGHLNLR